jgi:Zn-dependent peptidase ImmA (M78 family)
MTDRQAAEVLDGGTGDNLPGEQFANLFAGAFLMPGSAVRRRYDEVWEEHGKFSARSLVYLARTFYVSPEAMARRLEVLGLFAKGTYDILRDRGLDHTAVRSIRGEMEEGAVRPAFLPRYTLIAIEAYQKELISEGELAQMLRIGRIEARELVDDLQELTDTVEEQQRARA